MVSKIAVLLAASIFLIGQAADANWRRLGDRRTGPRRAGLSKGKTEKQGQQARQGDRRTGADRRFFSAERRRYKAFELAYKRLMGLDALSDAHKGQVRDLWKAARAHFASTDGIPGFAHERAFNAALPEAFKATATGRKVYVVKWKVKGLSMLNEALTMEGANEFLGVAGMLVHRELSAIGAANQAEPHRTASAGIHVQAFRLKAAEMVAIVESDGPLTQSAIRKALGRAESQVQYLAETENVAKQRHPATSDVGTGTLSMVVRVDPMRMGIDGIQRVLDGKLSTARQRRGRLAPEDTGDRINDMKASIAAYWNKAKASVASDSGGSPKYLNENINAFFKFRSFIESKKRGLFNAASSSLQRRGNAKPLDLIAGRLFAVSGGFSRDGLRLGLREHSMRMVSRAEQRTSGIAGENAFVWMIDVRNLTAVNRHFIKAEKSEAKGRQAADRYLRFVANTLKEEILALKKESAVASVSNESGSETSSPFVAGETPTGINIPRGSPTGVRKAREVVDHADWRQGGDEFGGVVTAKGLTQEQVDAALQRAQVRIAAKVKELGLQHLVHHKDKSKPPGTGIYFAAHQIVAGADPREVLVAASNALDLAKESAEKQLP